MPKLRALTPAQAAATRVARIGPRVNRVRQRLTEKGLRPHRVFIVWVRWSGERGEGDAQVALEQEILPTPKVESLDSVILAGGNAGVVPFGNLRVTEVDPTLPYSLLRGLHPQFTDPRTDMLRPEYEVFYEVVDDGRDGDPAPVRRRFRLMSEPTRRAGKLDWLLLLEKEDENRNRRGRPTPGVDENEQD